MKVIMENWRGYLTEEEAIDKELAKVMGDVFKTFSGKLATIEKPDEAELEKLKAKEGELNEVAVMAVIAFFLALPKILEMIANTVKWGWPKIEKLLGRAASGDKNKAAEKLISASHWIHDLYLKTIGGAVKVAALTFQVDLTDEQVEKISTVIFYIIIAFFAAYAGLEYAHFIASPSFSGAAMAGFEGAMVAIKTGEVGEFLAIVAAPILGVAKNAALAAYATVA